MKCAEATKDIGGKVFGLRKGECVAGFALELPALTAGGPSKNCAGGNGGPYEATDVYQLDIYGKVPLSVYIIYH